MTDVRCGTCKHWNAPKDKNGRRLNRRDRAAICTVEIVLPELPSCVSEASRRIHRSYMCSDQGRSCPLWESYK